MADEGTVRGEKRAGTGGVRTPLPGESSSANIPAPTPADLDSTDFDSQAFDSAATLLNIPASEIYAQAHRNTPADPNATLLNIPATDLYGESIAPTTNPRANSSATMPAFTPSTIGEASWMATPPPVEGELEPGRLLGNRYEIIQMLGIGGMGAVYKAKDVEIGRTVGLKVIRPEFARDRGIIERFKQELLLASQVTHKNVIRIYDLGEAEGMKFITMEYIDGRDLHAIVRQKGRFTEQESISLIRQICRALEAAHAVGVVHRDLKPQNVLMEEATGRALVMDFGLARTFEDNGMTQSGSLVGTMDYMSPEQALGKSVDQRSDIFTVGIMFFEFLTGTMPFVAQSAVASLIMRTQQPAVSCNTLDTTIPTPLCEIVTRCLERDVDRRYQSVSEILADLDAYEGGGQVTRLYPAFKLPEESPKKLSYLWIGAASLALILAIAGFFHFRASSSKTTGTNTAANANGVLSLAVFPLRNASGDPSIDWMSTSLADMLSTAVGQSEHLKTVSPESLRQVYTDLRLTAGSTIDDAMLKRIAGFTTADNVVSGQYVRLGDQVNIEVTLQDLKDGRTTTLKASAAEKDLPTAIASLAESVRKSLSLSSADRKAASAQSFQATSTSVAALRDYNQSLVLLRAGKNLEANKLLAAATQDDPQFALAFANLGHVQAELGFQAEAVQSSRRAVELADGQNLPTVVKQLIQANHARITQANKKAIDAYEVLARNLPGDTDIQFALASLYIETSAYDKARPVITEMLKADPKDVRALWQMGVIEITSNNAQTALDPLSKALSLTIQTGNDEMKALVELAIGISYRLLNKPEDATRNYQDSIALNEKLGQKRGVAAGLAEMAQVQSAAGNSDAALASYKRALQLLRDIGMTKEVGDTLMDMGSLLSDRGQTEQALAAYQEALHTQRETGDENFEALCLNNIASVYAARGDTGNAFTYFQQALSLREKLAVPGFLAETLAGMGDAYTQDGQYDEALKVLVRALELSRKADDVRGAALISHQIGQVSAAEGRFGAAVTSMQDALKALKTQNDKTKDLVEVQIDLANALARAGRSAEALTALDGAEALAKDLKSDALLGKLYLTRGDIELFKASYPAATQQYQKAQQTVAHLNGQGKDAGVAVTAKLNLAQVAIAQNKGRETIATLTSLVEKRSTFDRLLSVRLSTALAAALIQTQAYPKARQALLTTLGDAEKAGMRPEIARIYYLLSLTAKATKSPADAVSYSRQSLKVFDALKAEPGGNTILERADLKEMATTATQTIANNGN